MNMSIQNNILAMNANRMTGITSGKRSKSTEKLSSGYRVNRAADDAAGLAISEKMRWAIKGLEQGRKNIRDGISVCQIMDGAMNEVHDIMQRMTELSVQAANGTLNEEDRSYIQQEMNELTAELDRTTETTNFNEKPLLSCVEGVDIDAPATPGSATADVVFLVDKTGSMGGLIRNINDNIYSFAEAMSGCDVQYGIVQYGDISEENTKVFPFTSKPSEAKDNLGTIVAGGGGHSGGDGPESALDAIMDSLDGYLFRDGASREMILITDADYHYKGDGSSTPYTADEVKQALADKGVTLTVATYPGNEGVYKGKLTDEDILDVSGQFYDGILALAQKVTGRAGGKYHKSPDDIDIRMSSAPGDVYTIRTYNVNSKSLGLNGISVLTQEGAGKAIETIKKGMQRASEIRSQIGADQNALEHSYNVNNNVEENTTAAESQIRDTDMANEMVEYSNQGILEQAGAAMLSQANQSRQNILSLLQ